MYFNILFQISMCSYSYTASSIPQIISRSLAKDEILCINVIKTYTAVILNSWKKSIVNAYHTNSSEEMIHSGPYSKINDIGGFDFANTTGSVLITAVSETTINFGIYVYNNSNGVRIISNDPDDHISLDDDSDDALLIQNNQHLEYFNSAPASQTYDIDISTEPDTDTLTFFFSNKQIQEYSGTLKDTVKTASGNPVVVIWRTDKKNISGHAKINIISKYHPKYYIRIVTNDDKFMPIPVFKLASMLSLEIIVIVIISVVIFIILLIIIIYLFARHSYKRAKLERKDGKYQKANRMETEGENVLGPSINTETVSI